MLGRSGSVLAIGLRASDRRAGPGDDLTVVSTVRRHRRGRSRCLALHCDRPVVTAKGVQVAGPDGVVTLRDVARAAGVSTATASRALNDGPRTVGPALREQVLAAFGEA